MQKSHHVAIDFMAVDWKTPGFFLVGVKMRTALGLCEILKFLGKLRVGETPRGRF